MLDAITSKQETEIDVSFLNVADFVSNVIEYFAGT